MKRIAVLGLGLAMLLSFAGCTNTPAPTPTPLTTPVITPDKTTTPPAGNQGGVGAQTPGVSPGISPDVSPGTTPGQGLATIPNFQEGTNVVATDIPDIMGAFKSKYQDYEVVGITHGTLDNNQLYVVEYKDAAGKTGKAYLRADASWYDSATLTNTP